MAKKLYWWQELDWFTIQDRAKECDIAILPLGAIEWHGPHLPTGHDTYQLFPMMEAVAENTGAMLLPYTWYGAHPCHHYGVPGTIPLQNDTMRAVIKDIIRGAAIAGFNKFFLFFGHGQAFCANYAVQDLGMEGYFVASVMMQNFTKDVQFDIMEAGFWHADESETSIGLYTHPELVDMSKAGKEPAKGLLDPEFFQGVSEAATSKGLRFDELTVLAPETENVKAGMTGIFGDATIATVEKGKKYCEVIIERMSALVNHVKEKYPAGVKPFTVDKAK